VPGADYILGGPVYWFMVALLLLGGTLAGFIVLDSLRRAFFAHSSQPDARWWAYLAPQGAYLLLLLVVQGPWLPLSASAVVVLLTPFALIQSIAYLLRVVFPKPPAAYVEPVASGIEPGTLPEDPLEANSD
jgi:hypothetical protein